MKSSTGADDIEQLHLAIGAFGAAEDAANQHDLRRDVEDDTPSANPQPKTGLVFERPNVSATSIGIRGDRRNDRLAIALWDALEIAQGAGLILNPHARPSSRRTSSVL